jgi:hypothetical protein
VSVTHKKTRPASAGAAGGNMEDVMSFGRV